MERYKIPDKKKNTMTNMEIKIGLQVTKKTPINKGDFEQLVFALGKTVGLVISQ